MKILIKKVRIICAQSPFHLTVQDVLIDNGIIAQIGERIEENCELSIERTDLHMSVGWMDVMADFADPGFEYKETLSSGADAAAAGGFTTVIISPNTLPTISSKAQVEYILQKSAAFAVSIYPLASITKDIAGKELSEMYDMERSGAIAFSDGIKPIQNPAVLLKALQYNLATDKVIIQIPVDQSFAPHGLINESVVSTSLGLPGTPAIAEELMIGRDLALAAYTGGKLHVCGVSTKIGLEKIKQAKSEGINVSLSLAPQHLEFMDKDLHTYDTNLKVFPPLRTENDMIFLRDAMQTDVVDCFASLHLPQNTDEKDCEFEYAKAGMLSLETAFGVLNKYSAVLENLIQKLTINPRKIFGLPMPCIEVNAVADISLFCPQEKFTFTKEMIRSASLNSPMVGRELTGKVVGIINKNKVVLNDDKK